MGATIFPFPGIIRDQKHWKLLGCFIEISMMLQKKFPDTSKISDETPYADVFSLHGPRPKWRVPCHLLTTIYAIDNSMGAVRPHCMFNER